MGAALGLGHRRHYAETKLEQKYEDKLTDPTYNIYYIYCCGNCERATSEKLPEERTYPLSKSEKHWLCLPPPMCDSDDLRQCVQHSVFLNKE